MNRGCKTSRQTAPPILVPLALLLCVLLAACGGRAPSEPSPTTSTGPEVEVFVVRAGPAADQAAREAGAARTVPSSLAVEQEADLLAEEGGRLVEVLADQGQRVKRGQLLARLDDSRLRKQFDQDRAEMQALEVKARETLVLREAAEVELQRQSELRKEGLGSLRDFDRARFHLEAMKHEVERAGFDFEKAKALVEDDELRLAKTQLKAPFDGIVARRYARVGQLLLENEKVLRVTELHPLLVRFTVPESLRRTVDSGALVDVFPVERTAPGIRARVVRTGYVVDAASGLVECTAQLLEPVPEGLVPGMAVEVRIASARGPSGAGEEAAEIWLPTAAVRRSRDGTAEIFALTSSLDAVGTARLQRRAVQLGRETSTGVQVLSGVAAGDRIVAQVSENLREGMTVRVRR